MSKGIDVSQYQNSVNYQQVKASGIDFVIIRAGYGMYENQKDSLFESHYANAKAAGLHVGAYHYSYAKSAAEAQKEADVLLKWIAGKQFDYPVYFDIEDPSQANLGKGLITDITVAFCDKVEKAGYFTGVYASTDWLKNRLDMNRINRFTIWKADYRSNPDTSISCDIHQYTGSGQVNGISGRVDMNNATRDFPNEILSAGLNGYAPNQAPPVSNGQYAQVNVETLNVRSGGAPSFPIIEKLHYGNEVLVLSGANGWYQIDFGGKQGYVAAQYLTIGGIPGQYAQCNADRVNVREQPNTNSKVIRQLNRGNELIVTDGFNGWYHVIIAGTGGYVAAQYITVGGI